MAQTLVVIQGDLRPDPTARELYLRYIKATAPLMAQHQAGVFAVGEGLTSDHTTAVFSINAVLCFKSFEHASAFFMDPGYLEIKGRYRDPAYAQLSLSAFELEVDRGPLEPPPHGRLSMELLSCEPPLGGDITREAPHLTATGRWLPSMTAEWSRVHLWGPAQEPWSSGAPPERGEEGVRRTQWLNRSAQT